MEVSQSAMLHFLHDKATQPSQLSASVGCSRFRAHPVSREPKTDSVSVARMVGFVCSPLLASAMIGTENWGF